MLAGEGPGQAPAAVVGHLDPDAVLVEGVLQELAQLDVVVDQQGSGPFLDGVGLAHPSTSGPRGIHGCRPAGRATVRPAPTIAAPRP